MTQNPATHLIYRAFVQAAEEGRSNWRRMLLSELKSRILDITDRRFSEADYGARTFKSFVSQCSPAVSIEGDGGTIAAVLDPSLVDRARKEVLGENWTTPEDEIARHRSRGDHIGVGELLIGAVSEAPEDQLEPLFCRSVSAWASPATFQLDAATVHDLIDRIDQLVPENLALAVVHSVGRLRAARRAVPLGVTDLVYRLSIHISKAFSVRGKNVDVLAAAVALLESETQRLRDAVAAFSRSTAVTAKLPSVDVLKAAHAYAAIALPGERPLVRELDVILGPIFRKFCESCERHNSSDVGRRKDELLEHLIRFEKALQLKGSSTVATTLLIPIAEHVRALLEEGVRREEAFTRPSLHLAEQRIKVDLSARREGATFCARLQNTGQGPARRISLQSDSAVAADVSIVDPPGPFDLSAGTDQIVTFRVVVDAEPNSLVIPITWTCQTADDQPCIFDDRFDLAQQQKEPNWEALEKHPPYTINPVRHRAELFGRDSILQDLTLRALSGHSTFLWGQKRVGKTSVLQVLEEELRTKPNVSCVFLRMGELASLHEGEIAHTIATRLATVVANAPTVPPVDHFGAGLGRLVPFVVAMTRENPQQRLVLIVDEFDDIDPSFYVGERGRQFVKALRSLSEIGLTFFFAGSERMNTIYAHHSEDLNKWTNLTLDRIESRHDCTNLVTKPVQDALEYEDTAVNAIIDYCLANPFYMHLLCGEIFRQCWKERRTFVGETHVEIARQALLQTLGATNFAHFWEDNPELDQNEKRQQAAENCLALTCVSSLGAEYETEQDVVDAQSTLNLTASERVTIAKMRHVLQRLRRRAVLQPSRQGGSKCKIALPMLSEWLTFNAEAHLLERWRRHCTTAQKDESTSKGAASPAQFETFPIPEDTLLAVCAELVYLGKQKDVAEVRRWLRQFDDESRIEVAFLLLKRLVEKGFVNDGAIANGLTKMHEAIQDRRLQIGDRAWKIALKRNDNLCIAFVDSEVKSGGFIARELAKRARPGKCGKLEDVAPWINAHLEQDPILVIADDFAATGDTLCKGLARALKDHGNKFSRLIADGRVVCCVLSALPEALEKLRTEFPSVPVVPMRVFGDEIRALDCEGRIFEDEGTRKFANDMLLQIGRELVPQHPLGYGDLGILVAFHNTVPNSTLPVFWASGTVNGRLWIPLLPRA